MIKKYNVKEYMDMVSGVLKETFGELPIPKKDKSHYDAKIDKLYYNLPSNRTWRNIENASIISIMSCFEMGKKGYEIEYEYGVSRIAEFPSVEYNKKSQNSLSLIANPEGLMGIQPRIWTCAFFLVGTVILTNDGHFIPEYVYAESEDFITADKVKKSYNKEYEGLEGKPLEEVVRALAQLKISELE